MPQKENLKKLVDEKPTERIVEGMKTFLFLATLALAGTVHAAEWMTSYDDALARAKAENKVVVADFTGSDWCIWCMKLEKEIFSQPEFEKWASKHVVLLRVDFPRNLPQSAALKKMNASLAEKYHVEGFPTIVIMDATGKEVGRTGYKRMKPSEYVAHLEKLMK